MPVTVDAIYRYPVKGLNAQSLARVSVRPDEMLPHDRAYALALGGVPFDAGAPQWMSKTNFLMLMRDEKLAALGAEFDAGTATLSISRNGRQVARGNLNDAMGRAVIEQFFAAYMGEAARGQPKLVSAPGHNFSDTPPKVLSIINLNSVKDLERVTAAPVHPLRFRGNIYVSGLPAWDEFNWVGKQFTIGPPGGKVKLEVVKRIQRCAATHVNPETAERDMQVVPSLKRGFGHADMGIYARVLTPGELAPGDVLTPP